MSVALLASGAPAWRATRVDPLVPITNMRTMQEHTRREPGNVRFDVLRAPYFGDVHAVIVA